MIACTLSIENEEAFFSHVMRVGRINDIPLDDLVGRAIKHDRTGWRDFAFAAQKLQSLFEYEYLVEKKIHSEHSAALYFTATLPEPVRPHEIYASLSHGRGLLRSSVGSGWDHLRYCAECASSEFAGYRYSWWHRDHQLPLSSVCLPHESPLVRCNIREIGKRFPHELLNTSTDLLNRARQIKDLELAIARIEHALAKGEQVKEIRSKVENGIYKIYENERDKFAIMESACDAVKRFLPQLKRMGLIELTQDWDRIKAAIGRFVAEGWDYADPVAIILILISLEYPSSFGSDF